MGRGRLIGTKSRLRLPQGCDLSSQDHGPLAQVTGLLEAHWLECLLVGKQRVQMAQMRPQLQGRGIGGSNRVTTDRACGPVFYLSNQADGSESGLLLGDLFLVARLPLPKPIEQEPLPLNLSQLLGLLEPRGPETQPTPQRGIIGAIRLIERFCFSQAVLKALSRCGIERQAGRLSFLDQTSDSEFPLTLHRSCLLYTSDAADDL